MKFNYRKSSSFLVVLIFCFSIFIGCQSTEPQQVSSNSESASQPTVQQQDPSGSTSQLVEQVDRYKDVFDTSSDEGNLVARFLQIKSGTDTKSGDSTFIKSPDGKTMLIDAGAPECGPQIIEYLNDMGVKKIDYLVASHPHIDHIGGMAEIIETFDIGIVYTSRVKYPTNTYENFITTIQSNGIEVMYLEKDVEFKFGEMVTIKVYNPTTEIEYYDDYPENSTQFVNNHSAVMKLTYKDRSMLFTGDIYLTREIELVEKYGDELKSDILKIPHHGADTSSTKTFIEAVEPEVGVMLNDTLASLHIYNRYRKNNCATYTTFVDGCVKVSTDGNNIDILTQFDRQNDFLK